MHAAFVKVVANIFSFSLGLEIIIPTLEDWAVCAPYGFFAIYVDQLRVGLHLSPFPLIVSLFRHYEILFTQLVLNAIRMIIAFKLYYRANRVDSSVDLFHFFFMIKCSPMKSWYAFFPIVF